LSNDKGRHQINPAKETANAFRTGTLKNAAKTMPYMHNGVFKTLKEVIDFYDQGGGAGRGLSVTNQTLSEDKLNLTELEKKQIILFIESLTERMEASDIPKSLPKSKFKNLNQRVVHGVY
jgi:cytochrome c peroxidase